MYIKYLQIEPIKKLNKEMRLILQISKNGILKNVQVTHKNAGKNKKKEKQKIKN